MNKKHAHTDDLTKNKKGEKNAQVSIGRENTCTNIKWVRGVLCPGSSEEGTFESLVEKKKEGNKI